jgi:hypothetical protein
MALEIPKTRSQYLTLETRLPAPPRSFGEGRKLDNQVGLPKGSRSVRARGRDTGPPLRLVLCFWGLFLQTSYGNAARPRARAGRGDKGMGAVGDDGDELAHYGLSTLGTFPNRASSTSPIVSKR